ncbi:transcription regulator [Lactococcus termiticola]|uniref:Transcription regulator n=2 Tax=Lactococcus termiticola TaxID=2169526 RepID=A0A2R5HIP6_9LACT|nr:transcription regulator [Lactococcus termiticola]
MDAFFMLVDEVDEPRKISMEMIAGRVGIRRQSIYEKHFSSVSDLMTTIFELVSSPCELKIQAYFAGDKSQDFFDFFAQEILPLLYEKRDWLKLLYSKVIAASWSDFAQRTYLPYVEAYLKDFPNETGLSDRFRSDLLVRQVIAIVASWLTSEKVEPASLFAPRFLDLLGKSSLDLIGKS